MNKKIFAPLALATAMTWVAGSAQAAIIGLFDYGYNIDGAVSVPTLGDPVPAGVDESGFNTTTGLGTITVLITGAGAHTFDFFIDLEIDEAINTFFNETGAASGTPAAGQSWEIDEPGFVDGDIFVNFQNSALDNGIGTSVFGDTVFPDDVSMAMGWDFTLGVNQEALISLNVSQAMPMGFFLTHSDPDSQADVYLLGALEIRQTGVQVPEPGTLVLFGIGLLGLGLLRRRMARRAV